VGSFLFVLLLIYLIHCTNTLGGWMGLILTDFDLICCICLLFLFCCNMVDSVGGWVLFCVVLVLI